MSTEYFIPQNMQLKQKVEGALKQLQPYLSAEEMAHARTLKTFPEVEQYLKNCINRRFSEHRQQQKVSEYRINKLTSKLNDF